MKKIIENKLFDLDNAEKLCMFTSPSLKKVVVITLFKTPKNNYVSKYSDATHSSFYYETEESVKKLLRQNNQIETYQKLFNDLEEL